MFGSVTRQNVCKPLAPSSRAASSSSVPCACISGISSRATNGKVTNIVASTMPDTAKMTWMPWRLQPRAEPALPAEQQHEDHARDDRRNAVGQVDQRNQQALAGELELGDGPGRDHAEHRVDRHGNHSDQQGQADGRQGVAVAERAGVHLPAAGCSAWANTATSGTSRNRARNASATPISSRRNQAASVVAAAAVPPELRVRFMDAMPVMLDSPRVIPIALRNGGSTTARY